jgi:hypothetical protein
MRVIALDRYGERESSPHVFERFLREREGVWRQIAHEHRLDALIKDMLIHAAGAIACYGAVLGLSHSFLQALASLVKLPLLFLLTLAICLPALYLSNLLLGGRLSARQVFALLLSALTVSAVFLLASVPITVFFLLTAQSYTFFVLLNVFILALTSTVGLRLLVEGVHRINTIMLGETTTPAQTTSEENAGQAPPRPVIDNPANVRLLQIWLLLYAFVGTQLGWTIRPFFGMPGSTFHLFRPAEGNFYESVITMLHGLFF